MPSRDAVRPGPGGAKSVRLVVRVSEAQMAALRSFADRRGQDVSAAVREVLTELLLPEDE